MGCGCSKKVKTAEPTTGSTNNTNSPKKAIISRRLIKK